MHVHIDLRHRDSVKADGKTVGPDTYPGGRSVILGKPLRLVRRYFAKLLEST